MGRQVVATANWNNYVGEFEGSPVFISYDRSAKKLSLMSRLSHCARVMIPIHKPNHNGGPQEPESVELWNLEDGLCTLLYENAVECRLVARLTYKGIRELVFQLADWESFRPIVGAWMLQDEVREIDVSEHEGWSFIENTVWSSATEHDR